MFAPGADNYFRMGAVHEMWQEGDWTVRLVEALAMAESESHADRRAALGLERGGRMLAAPVAAAVCEG